MPPDTHCHAPAPRPRHGSWSVRRGALTRALAALGLAGAALLGAAPAHAGIAPAVAPPAAHPEAGSAGPDAEMVQGFEPRLMQRPVVPDLEPDLLSFSDGATTFALAADPTLERVFSDFGGQALATSAGTTCIAAGSADCDVPEPATYGLVALAVAASLVPGALRRRRDRDER